MYAMMCVWCQRTTFRSQWSPSTMGSWIKFRSSGLCAALFPAEPSQQPDLCIYLECLWRSGRVHEREDGTLEHT